MLQENAPFGRAWRLRGGLSAIEELAHFIERRLGATFVYDKNAFLYGRDDLIDLYETAESLRRSGIIDTFGPNGRRSDEPALHLWFARRGKGSEKAGGGGSLTSDRDALAAALAEALERHIWTRDGSYFRSPQRMTTGNMRKRQTCVAPEQFVGFSETQRSERAKCTLRPDAEYLWIKGYSWTRGAPTMIPAQTVSGWHGSLVYRKRVDEPLILEPISTGLATWSSREGAALRGALEIIERDAFMIMWLNQLSLPLIDTAALAKEDAEWEQLLKNCMRYRLNLHVVRMITDSPTHAVCAIVEDMTGNAPCITLGLKAGPSLTKVARAAVTEALRVRYNARNKMEKSDTHGEHLEKSTLKHSERLLYWACGDRYKKLQFLIRGEISAQKPTEWQNDDDSAHLERITRWCREKNYEFASVSLGKFKHKSGTWYVEMAVIPELQPLHQNENNAYLGGARLKEVPHQFGYTATEYPFADEPHPFA